MADGKTRSDLGPTLSRDEIKGWTLENGTRIISFRVKSFQALVDRITGITGYHVARTLFFQMGNEIGRVAFLYSKRDVGSETDLRKVFDRLLILRGWGRCLEVTRREELGKTIYVFKIAGTPLSYERTAPQPTCHMVLGIVAGWLESYLGKKALNYVEKKCASTGSEVCEFETTLG